MGKFLKQKDEQIEDYENKIIRMKENHDKTQNMITKELETNMYNYKELTQQFEE